MKLRDKDLEWLAANFPELAHFPQDRSIVGTLRFCAAYDKASNELKLGDTGEHRSFDAFLCDVFRVKFDLNCAVGNGWPKIYETGGRCYDIAERNQCELIDLHLFADGSCCLGLNYSTGKLPTLERFIPELVIPFFYRLSYTDRYGLSAARGSLWGEYSHGDAGVREYQNEILRLARPGLERNQLCPCGSGVKFKKCHLDEVEAVRRSGLR